MIQVIVTRHQALVEYLRCKNAVAVDVEVIAHITSPEQVAGKVVAGVLPLHLAAAAEAIVNVQLNLPPDLRGVELTLEQVEQYAAGIQAYRVEELDPASL